MDEFEDWASKEKDWKVSRSYDLFQINNEYIKFFWTQNFHLETFKKILATQSCSLGQQLSYKTIRVSYMAWILNENLKTMVWNLFKKTPCLSKKVAIYVVNKAFNGLLNCLKLNETENIVFDEFEKFLIKNYGIKPRSFFTNNINTATKCLMEV